MMYGDDNKPRGYNRKQPMESNRDRYCDGARKIQSEYGKDGGLDDIVDFRVKNQKANIWTVLAWLFCIFGIGGILFAVLILNSTKAIIIFAILALACKIPEVIHRLYYSSR